MDQRVLRQFGHVERMAEYRMARRVWRASTGLTEVRLDKFREGGRLQQRNNGGGCANDTKEWRALVHI